MTKESATVYEALMFQFRFGHMKAMGIVESLGTTMDDIKDWLRYEDAKGTKLACHNMKKFKNPRDIPQEKLGTEATTGRKTFAQMDAEDYDRKKAEFEKERENDVSRNSEDAQS